MQQDMEILDTDKKLGIINHTKIIEQTRIPCEDGLIGCREQMD